MTHYTKGNCAFSLFVEMELGSEGGVLGRQSLGEEILGETVRRVSHRCKSDSVGRDRDRSGSTGIDWGGRDRPG